MRSDVDGVGSSFILGNADCLFHENIKIAFAQDMTNKKYVIIFTNAQDMDAGHSRVPISRHSEQLFPRDLAIQSLIYAHLITARNSRNR